jgi:hypothetical protein
VRAIGSVPEESCYKTDAECAARGRGVLCRYSKVNQGGKCCYIIDLVLLSFKGLATSPWL